MRGPYRLWTNYSLVSQERSRTWVTSARVSRGPVRRAPPGPPLLGVSAKLTSFLGGVEPPNAAPVLKERWRPWTTGTPAPWGSFLRPALPCLPLVVSSAGSGTHGGKGEPSHRKVRPFRTCLPSDQNCTISGPTLVPPAVLLFYTIPPCPTALLSPSAFSPLLPWRSNPLPREGGCFAWTNIHPGSPS